MALGEVIVLLKIPLGHQAGSIPFYLCLPLLQGSVSNDCYVPITDGENMKYKNY
jgi:hypothetical protein